MITSNDKTILRFYILKLKLEFWRSLWKNKLLNCFKSRQRRKKVTSRPTLKATTTVYASTRTTLSTSIDIFFLSFFLSFFLFLSLSLSLSLSSSFFGVLSLFSSRLSSAFRYFDLLKKFLLFEEDEKIFGLFCLSSGIVSFPAD